MSAGPLREHYIYSPILRLFHWIMVASIYVLFFTGLYIGNPGFIGSIGIEPTFAVANLLSMENIRFIHFIAAYILSAAMILRIYSFFRYKGDRLLPRFWGKLYWQGMWDIFLHYILIRKNHQPYIRNSLARTTYLVVYIMIFLEIITGFAMYYMINPNGFGAKIFGYVNHLLIDEYVVHIIHHYIAWFFAIFVIIHVYMSARADFMEKEGEISSMFSGVKFYADDHTPLDIGDVREDAKENSPTRHR